MLNIDIIQIFEQLQTSLTAWIKLSKLSSVPHLKVKIILFFQVYLDMHHV